MVEFLLPARCLGCDHAIPLGAHTDRVCGTCLTRFRAPPWPRCSRCDNPLGTGRVSGSCLACRSWPPVLRWARSAVILEDPAARLVHALKYEGWRELAPLMAQRLAALDLPDDTQRDEVLVSPVPTTSARKRKRGYNQAALLAEPFAQARAWTCLEVLERRSGGGSQIALLPSQRRSNVRDAFSVPPAARSRIQGRHVLLVDDVLTTGATACEAAIALEREGAAGVSLITFARALPDRQRP